MNREAFKTEAKALIDELFQKIDTLEQRKQEAQAELREQIDQQLIELRKHKKDLQHRYDQLSSAGSDSWDEIKRAFSESAGSFQHAVANISRNFR